MSFVKENWFKFGILICLLLIAYTAYQSFVVIPRENVRKEEVAAQLKEEKIEQEANDKQEKLDSCLNLARSNYDTNWNNSCRTLGELSNYCSNVLDPENGYRYYLKENATITSIATINKFSKAKEDCSCGLPTVTAKRWDDTFKEEKDVCYLRYK